MNEDEKRASRALMLQMTVGRRAWWAYVGAMTLWAAITVVQLLWHRSTI